MNDAKLNEDTYYLYTASSVESALIGSFQWEKSNEGDAYWAQVIQDLRDGLIDIGTVNK